MERNRLKDVTYANWHDDYNFYMNRRQFKKWFKQIGSPSDFHFWLTSNGNEVFNYKTKTERKECDYEIHIRAGDYQRALVMKTHRRENRLVEKEWQDKYTRWANQVLAEKLL